MQGIEKEGVIVLALARPKADGGYELIAGHRRKVAFRMAFSSEIVDSSVRVVIE